MNSKRIIQWISIMETLLAIVDIACGFKYHIPLICFFVVYACKTLVEIMEDK